MSVYYLPLFQHQRLYKESHASFRVGVTFAFRCKCMGGKLNADNMRKCHLREKQIIKTRSYLLPFSNRELCAPMYEILIDDAGDKYVSPTKPMFILS